MSKPIHRRDFLKGAASLAAGSMLGSSTALAQVAGITQPRAKLYFWDGTRFQLASRQPASEVSGMATVDIRAFGAPDLSALEHLVSMPQGRASFVAWSQAPGYASHVRFSVDTAAGLRLRATDGGGSYNLPLGDAGRLREGVYVLSTSSPVGYSFKPGEEGGPVQNGVGTLPRGYLVIEIERS